MEGGEGGARLDVWTDSCLPGEELGGGGGWHLIHDQDRRNLCIFLSIGLGPFSFRSPPMEMQPPVSPQQSECNPVGALQVCLIFIFVCAVSSELGL